MLVVNLLRPYSSGLFIQETVFPCMSIQNAEDKVSYFQWLLNVGIKQAQRERKELA